MKKLIIGLILLFTINVSAQNSDANIMSRYNTTTTLLNSAGVFTGTAELLRGYNSISVTIRADQSGTYKVLFGNTSTITTINAVKTYSFSYTANDTLHTKSVPVDAPYFKIVFTNSGVVAQTKFYLITMLNRGHVLPITNAGKLDIDGTVIVGGITFTQAQIDSLQKVSEFPNGHTYADIRNSWDWARSFADYRDTVKVNSVAVDTTLIGGTEWAKITVRGTSATDSLYVGFGTVAPTVWHKVIGTTPFVTEKLNHTYFTKIFLKGYGATNSIKSYEITIESF